VAKEKKSSARADLGTFEPAWLDAGSDQARALVDEAGERGADLVAAWIARKNAHAVAAVAADDHAPTEARKAARRGINVLKSRGVAIPERARVASVAAAAPDMFEAWFRPPDGAGTSAFTLGARSSIGRYRLVDVIIKHGVGLVSIAGMEMSRSQLRETFAGISQRFGHPPAPVPVAWARARIAAARSVNDQSKTPVPLGFESHRDLLGPAPATMPPHPADELEIELGDRGEALAGSAKLHGEPELRGWLPEPAAMQKMLMAVGANVGPAGSADAATAEAKVHQVIAQATDEFFTEEIRDDVAARVKDAAISMFARGARDRASDALAVAEAIRSLDPRAPPHGVPFLTGFFEKAFGLAATRFAARKS
jgi:hypothetical protein